MTEHEHDEWLTIQEVADILKVHEESIRRWVRSGALPVLDLGSAKAGYRIRRSDLEHFTGERYGLVGKSAA